MLSLAVIYTVLSLTVSQRTREIGIRVALGSDTRGIITAMFSQPLAHVGIGVGAGAVLVGLLTLIASGGVNASELGFIVLYSSAMAVVCTLACVVPTRRAPGGRTHGGPPFGRVRALSGRAGRTAQTPPPDRHP